MGGGTIARQPGKENAVAGEGYAKNRRRFSAEQLAPYEEKYVAFSSDGMMILAHAHTYLELTGILDEMGATEYEIERIPSSDSALIM